MLVQEDSRVAYQAASKCLQWSRAYKEAGWIFLLSRSILLLVTFIAPSVFPHFAVEYHQVNHQMLQVHVIHAPVQCAVEFEHCLQAWDAWDNGVFVDVAHRGYPALANKQNLVAFFPLWPFIMHIVGACFGGSSKTLFYAGILLSNSCFYFCLVLLYYLVSLEFSSPIAKHGLFLLALGPYALFFFIGYSEAFFLLCCLGTFFFLRRGCYRDWWFAGLCGFLASLTRATGFLLIVPFLVLYVQRFWPCHNQIRIHWRLFLKMALPILLVPCGLVLYMIYLGVTKHNPLAFSAAERTWGRQLDFPWAGIVNALRSFIIYRSNFEENSTDLFFTLFPLIMLLIYWKRLPRHYSLFSLAMSVFPLIYPIQGVNYPLSSLPRFLMVIFPLYIPFAICCEKPRVRAFLQGLSLALFTIYAVLFICHGWVA